MKSQSLFCNNMNWDRAMSSSFNFSFTSFVMDMGQNAMQQEIMSYLNSISNLSPSFYLFSGVIICGTS